VKFVPPPVNNVVHRALLLAGTSPVQPDHLALESAATPETAPAAAVTAAAAIAGATLPPRAKGTDSAPTDVRGEMRALERQRIVDALAQCHGNQTRAAEALGMPRRTLVKRMGQYGIMGPRSSRNDGEYE